MRAGGHFIARTIQAVKLLAHDGRIPRPLRWAAAVWLLPVPGPLDELVLLIVATILWLLYPDRLSVAWQRANEQRLAEKRVEAP